MRNFAEKLNSRKFVACISGVLTGIALLISGNIIEGAVTVIASIGVYITAEGYIDAQSVKNTINITQDVLDGVLKDFEDFEEEEVSQDASDT